MVKIAFVSQPRDPVVAAAAQRGSVTTVLWELATRIARRHDTMVFAPRAPGQAAEESYDSLLGIYRVPAWRELHKALDLGTGMLRWRLPYFASSAYFREYGLAVARALERYRPDIVHLQNHSHFLPLFRRAVPCAQLIMHVHDELHSLLPAEPIRARLRDVTAIVTPSEFVTRRIEERMSYLEGRVNTIGNGVDTATFRPIYHDTAADRYNFRILYVGRVSPEKGVHTLAAAFAQLLDSGVRAELDIVGPVGLLPLSQVQLLARDPHMAALRQFYGRGLWGSLETQLLRARSGYRRYIESLVPAGSRDRLRFLGQLSRNAVIGLYHRADVLVIPSLCEEPFGLPIAEGMACGLPCVASNAGGIPDLIEHERTGLLVERGDTGGLAAALRRLADEPAAREQFGRLARERAERLFDWSVPAARLEALYQRTLARPCSAKRVQYSAVASTAP
ncbi:MAG TPA: glycosyltransferase family 4 protein [Steroidobacteraceae bacterium]|nr:glycosyltransferase family 4 protein [Steroidobacteraceae bacterium]